MELDNKQADCDISTSILDCDSRSSWLSDKGCDVTSVVNGEGEYGNDGRYRIKEIVGDCNINKCNNRALSSNSNTFRYQNDQGKNNVIADEVNFQCNCNKNNGSSHHEAIVTDKIVKTNGIRQDEQEHAISGNMLQNNNIPEQISGQSSSHEKENEINAACLKKKTVDLAIQASDTSKDDDRISTPSSDASIAMHRPNSPSQVSELSMSVSDSVRPSISGVISTPAQDIDPQQLELLISEQHKLSLRATVSLGGALIYRSRFRDAAEVLCAAVDDILRGERRGQNEAGDLFHNLTIAYSGMGEYERAIETAQHAVRLYNAMNAHDHVASAFVALASASLECDRPQFVLDMCLEPLKKWEVSAIQNQPENRTIVAMLYALVARACYQLGHLQAAADSMHSAVRVCPVKSGYRATMLQNLGAALNAVETFEEAITYHKQAMQLFVKSLDVIPEHLANIRDNLGYAEGMTGDLASSSVSLERAHDLWLEAKLPNMAVASLERLGALMLRFDLPQRALVYFQQALSSAATHDLNDLVKKTEQKIQNIWDYIALQEEEQRQTCQDNKGSNYGFKIKVPNSEKDLNSEFADDAHSETEIDQSERRDSPMIQGLLFGMPDNSVEYRDSAVEHDSEAKNQIDKDELQNGKIISSPSQVTCLLQANKEIDTPVTNKSGIYSCGSLENTYLSPFRKRIGNISNLDPTYAEIPSADVTQITQVQAPLGTNFRGTDQGHPSKELRKHHRVLSRLCVLM